MVKNMILVLGMVAFLSPSFADLGPVVKITSSKKWVNQLNKEKRKIILIDFTAVWCGPCRQVAPTFADRAKHHKDVAGFYKVDVDEMPLLTSKFRVDYMPYFVALKKGPDGKFHQVPLTFRDTEGKMHDLRDPRSSEDFDKIVAILKTVSIPEEKSEEERKEKDVLVVEEEGDSSDDGSDS